MSEKVIFHVDLDAFFAAVEVLDHPEYKGKPLIVGGEPGGRGVVSTCSYEARKFGVHSAMPTFRAAKLCPQGIFVRPRMKRYQEYSAKVMDIFGDFTPDIRQVSIDEAYLDMSGTSSLFGPPVEAAKQLKETVFQRTGLRISVGVAPNHFLAKIASDYQKPDGLTIVPPGKEEAFLDTVALRKIPGLGKKMQERLEELGIESVSQLRTFPKDQLIMLTSRGAGEFLWRSARGLESLDHGAPAKSHSLSAETTLGEDTSSRDLIRRVLLDLAQQVMFRMLDGGWRGKTPMLKIKYEDFRSVTVQKTLRHWVTSGEELHGIIMDLLKSKWKGTPKIRLLGVGFQQIEKIDSFHQGELFEEEGKKQRQVEESVFRIKAKFPDLPMVKASLLGQKTRSSPQRKTEEKAPEKHKKPSPAKGKDDGSGVE